MKCFSESPQLVITPQNTTAYIGESVWINCQGKGHPIPQIHYLRDSKGGGNLSETHFMTMKNNTLHIKDLREEDSGRYICWLTHKYGSVSANFELNVKGIVRLLYNRSCG